MQFFKVHRTLSRAQVAVQLKSYRPSPCVAGLQRCLGADGINVDGTETITEASPTAGRSAAAISGSQIPAAQRSYAPYRCLAVVSLEEQSKGSGYVAHPAVTDNCMQLGPITGALEAVQSGIDKGKTRVVAGLAAFCARSDY